MPTRARLKTSRVRVLLASAFESCATGPEAPKSARHGPARWTRNPSTTRCAKLARTYAARPDGVEPAALSLSDESVLTTPLDDKIAMAIELERRVREGDARIRQVDSANYSDYVAEAAVVSSMGIRAAYSRSGAFLSVEAIASDGHDEFDTVGLGAYRDFGKLFEKYWKRKLPRTEL